MARQAKGLNQSDIAKLFKISRPSVTQWESAESRPDPAKLPALATLLGVTVDWLLEGDETTEPLKSGFNPPPEILGERDLPVFASVEGGDGALILSSEPIDHVLRPWYLKKVKDGYAVLVNGTSMEPRYEPGDMVVVNPKAARVKGKDVILFSNAEHGVQRAIVKRYMGENAAEWFLRQFNPPEGEKADFRLFKHDWPTAVRVTGSYDGG